MKRRPFTLEDLQALRVKLVRRLIDDPRVMVSSEQADVAGGTVRVTARRQTVCVGSVVRTRPSVDYYLNGIRIRRVLLETKAAAGYL